MVYVGGYPYINALKKKSLVFPRGDIASLTFNLLACGGIIY